MRRHHAPGIGALLVALAAAGAVLFALFGFKFGWIAWPLADTLLNKLPQPLALVAIALGVVGAIMALLAKPRAGVVLPLVAIVIAAVTYAAMSMQAAQEAKFPPIHDVSTGWQAPPMPSAALATERGKEASLPVEKAPVVAEGTVVGLFGGRTVAEVNATTCKAAVPVMLTMPPAQAYAAAFKVVKDGGLRVVAADAATGSIDAVATNFWSMKEDAMIRVRAEGAGSRIDIRSISRHGANDRGHNCRRVGELRDALAVVH